MLELAVTALRSNVVPPVLLDKSNCVSDFHVTVPRTSWHDVDRRGVETKSGEAGLSQSSTPTLAHRETGPAIARTDC
jgi:hypothetical protein